MRASGRPMSFARDLSGAWRGLASLSRWQFNPCRTATAAIVGAGIRRFRGGTSHPRAAESRPTQSEPLMDQSLECGVVHLSHLLEAVGGRGGGDASGAIRQQFPEPGRRPRISSHDMWRRLPAKTPSAERLHMPCLTHFPRKAILPAVRPSRFLRNERERRDYGWTRGS